MRVLLAIILLLVPVVTAQGQEACVNGVGVFNDPDPAPGTWFDQAYVTAVPGVMHLYVVLFNAYNEHTEQPVPLLAGYEFHVDYPASFLYVGGTYCQGVIIQDGMPDVSVMCEVPVTGDHVVLATLDFFFDGSADAEIFLQPLSAGAAIPGFMSIVDAAGGTSSRAYAISGGNDQPVFVVNGGTPPAATGQGWPNCAPVPAAARRFGGIKALYR